MKKLLTLSLGDTRVTPVELQTILFECANICNERPIGMSKPREDGSYFDYSEPTLAWTFYEYIAG